MKHSARGQFVYDRLNAVANQSQAGAVPSSSNSRPVQAVLDRQRDPHPWRRRSWWTVAARPEVAEVLATRTYEIPKPARNGRSAIDAVGQHRHRRAVRPPGAGRQYRGNLGGGTFDHNYNWFDPRRSAGPRRRPATTTATARTRWARWSATTATGQPDRRRPGRKWIAAKGCETNTCSDRRCSPPAQWILAPTDLNGRTRGPTCARHRQQLVGRRRRRPVVPGDGRRLDRRRHLPAFSNGNAARLRVVGSPGDYVRATAPARSTSTTTSPASPSRGPSALAARSSRTSPRRA